MTHKELMALALTEAAKGKGKTHPNPMVGCVISKNRLVIAKGYHHKAGAPHAEMVALKRAGTAARDAHMYVNLEPCCHNGRTGPCTEALIDAGIKQVYVGVRDSNPKVSGRGLKRLQQAGVKVTVGLLSDQAQQLNEAFAYAMRTGRPFVIAKTAQSLDGRVATRTGESQWITGPAARSMVQTLRAEAGAILVGRGTIEADDPRLTCRNGGRDPMRVILDTHANTSPRSKVVRACKRSKTPTIIMVGTRAPATRRNALEQAGAQTLSCRLHRGHLDIQRVLEILGQLEVRSLLVEGGPTVLGAFADAGRINMLHTFIAPFIIGGENALAAVHGKGIARLRDALSLTDMQTQSLGSDLHLFGHVKQRQ